MNGILAMSNLLAASPLTSDQRECIDAVLDSSHAMMRLLNDLLLCSKMDAGRFELNLAPCRIDRIVKNVSDTVQRRLATLPPDDPRSGALTWNMQMDPRLPVAIIADAERLKQILHNLIDNALKVRSHKP
jgi:signal transduction histidine kinase